MFHYFPSKMYPSMTKFYSNTLSDGSSGYIMVSANGGINQQRVAVSYIMV